eukprot:2385238-Prymnesium_polylepis.1
MPASSLTLLLAGDIHDDIQALSALQSDLMRCRWAVDAIVSTGDFTTGPQTVLPAVNRTDYVVHVRAALRNLGVRSLYW